MVVRPQNAAVAALRREGGNQLVGRFLGAGFYYKTFIRPQRLWPAYQKVLSRFAAGGKLTGSPSGDRFDQRYAHVDVCVAGGGRRGWRPAPPPPRPAPGCSWSRRSTGSAAICATAARRGGGAGRDASGRRRHENLEVMTNAVVTGRYDDNWLAVVERQPPSGADGGPPVFERLSRSGRGPSSSPQADRASVRVRGQRRAGRAAVDGGPPADQPVGGPAGAGRGPHRQRRR